MTQLQPGSPHARPMHPHSFSWPQQAWRRARQLQGSLELSRWGFWGAAAAVVVLCALLSSSDYSSSPRERRTAALLQAWGGASTMQQWQQQGRAVQLHSSIGHVNLEAGLLTLDLTLTQHAVAGDGDYCSQGAGGGPLLLVGSTAAPSAQVVLPLCQLPAEHSFSAVLPLQQQPSQPQPFDRHTAEVRVQLASAPAAVAAEQQEQAPVAGRPALPAVAWSGLWAAPGLQVAVQRQSRSATARLLAALAAAGGADEGGGWGSSLLEPALAAAAAADGGGGGSAIYQVTLARCWWLRVAHLTAAAVQLAAVGGCCLLLLGQCLASYLMQRLLLCSRAHQGAWA